MTFTEGRTEALATRNQLIDAARRVQADGPDSLDGADEPVGFGPAVVVAFHRAHLVSTVVRSEDARQIDVWLSDAGVVALARQDTDDDPTPLIGLPTVKAYEVVASALGLSPALTAASEPFDVPRGLDGLAQDVASGDMAEAILHAVELTTADRHGRAVILETPAGIVAALDAPHAVDEPLTLMPTTPVAVARWLSATVVCAIETETSTS